jgi:hypothetical protein
MRSFPLWCYGECAASFSFRAAEVSLIQGGHRAAAKVFDAEDASTQWNKNAKTAIQGVSFRICVVVCMCVRLCVFA